MSAPSLTVPRKLHRGDTIRVVAPARSRQFVAEHDHSGVIDARFAAQAASFRLCDPDAHRLCGGVAAGDGNVLDCLLASWKVVSQQCNKAITDAGWR